MRLARILISVGLALLAACSDPVERGASPTPTTPSPTRTAGRARQVAFVTTEIDGTDAKTQNDLWVYDVAADTVTRLTTDGKRHFESLPRFHGRLVSYVVDGRKLVETDPATKATTTILSVTGRILAFAWNEEEIAYIEYIENDDGTHRLRIRDTASGRTSTIKTLGTPPGRHTGPADTLSIAWSQDGQQLLVTDTHVDEDPMVRVLRRDGSDVISPIRNATNALWSHDEKSIYFSDVARDVEDRPMWQKLDIAKGNRTRLALDGGTHHVALSPDGTQLAGVRSSPSTYPDAVIEVLDLASGTTRQGPKDVHDPVWLSADSYAATTAKECPPRDDECAGIDFRGAGTRLYRRDGTSSTLALKTTLWHGLGGVNTDVLYA